MKSVLTKQSPIPLIHFTYLLLLAFYSFHYPSWPLFLVDLLAAYFLIKNYPKCFFKMICLLLFATGYFFLQEVKEQKAMNKQVINPNQVRLIPDSLSINGDSMSFIASDHNDNDYKIFYRLKNKKEADFFKGNSDFLFISAAIKLEKAEQMRNFSGFDYREFLKKQGIYRVGRISDIRNIRISKVNSIFEHLRKWRRQGIILCQRQFPKPMSDYMTGLLFGYLDKSFGQMTQIYSQLGIIHLFALSGMQVSFFLNLFRKVLVICGIPKDHFPYFDLPFSIVYAFLTGLSISVMRSLLQRNLRNFQVKGLDNLSLAFLLMFFFQPNFLHSIGGILSFAYAFFITIISCDHFEGKKRILVETLVLSICLLPFLMIFFGQFNPVAIILTAVFSLLFDSLILPVLCLAFLLSPIIKLSSFNPIFMLMERLVSSLGQHFSRAIIFGKPNSFQFLLLIILIAVLLHVIKEFRKTIGILVVIFVLSFSIRLPFTNEVTIVDIGQGDSILIRDTWNRTILIDVGGSQHYQGKEAWQKKYQEANAEGTLIPYLKSRGISKIDQLVLTHTDNDHVGDMEAVARHIRIKEILVSQGSLKNSAFLSRLKKINVPTSVVQAGDRLPIMGSYLQVLYPWKIGDGKNNDSITLYGKLLNQNFLFTGDLEAEGEEDIMEKYTHLPVDILKAGHHGSKGSSSKVFLKHISAKVALVSAGKNNHFHHPHPETLNRFRERGMTVYRTDQEGAIRFTGWKEWQVETCH